MEIFLISSSAHAHALADLISMGPREVWDLQRCRAISVGQTVLSRAISAARENCRVYVHICICKLPLRPCPALCKGV